jgi:hypothetical protein
MSKSKIVFNLLGNALESLEHAVDHLTFVTGENTHSDYKHAILDVSHAAELLIKERLYRIHPAFIWENIDKYPSLDARTVSAKKGLERLFYIGELEISDEDKSSIRSCRRVRNAIEHHKFEINEKEAKIVIGRTLAFVFDFSLRHLDLNLRAEFETDDRWESLLGIYEFVQAYGARIERKLNAEGRYAEMCSKCGGMTFDITSETCALCGHTEVLDG